MATYEYQALTESGRLMRGTLEAASPEQVRQLLEEMKLSVNSLSETKPERSKSAIGRNEFVLFNQQLASLTKAGLPLEKGLRELARDISSSRMRRAIDEIATDLEKGMSVEEAFEKRKGVFPPLYGRILKAGVETGRLGEMLISMNRHLEMAGQTRRIVCEALSYPAVILFLAAVIVTFIFILIIPQFRDMYHDMGVELPFLTTMILSITDYVWGFWLVVGGMAVGLHVLYRALRGSIGGRVFLENLTMRIPILGRVYHNSVLCRLADAMALLIGSGSDLSQALLSGADASGSIRLQQESQVVSHQLERGETILEAGQFSRIIPRMFFYSIQLGAQRNELQDNLYCLTEMYSQQAKSSQAKLSLALLPTLLIFVGGIVALIILGLFLPMVSMLETLS